MRYRMQHILHMKQANLLPELLPRGQHFSGKRRQPRQRSVSVSYTHLDVYKRQAEVTEQGKASKLDVRMKFLEESSPLGANHPAVKQYNKCMRGAGDTVDVYKRQELWI